MPLIFEVSCDMGQRGIPFDRCVSPCVYLYHSGFLVFLQNNLAADLSFGSTSGSSSLSITKIFSFPLYLRLSLASFASVPEHDWQIDQSISACLSLSYPCSPRQWSHDSRSSKKLVTSLGRLPSAKAGMQILSKVNRQISFINSNV